MNCGKCGKVIGVGDIFKKVDKKPRCETCLGITNPWDNPDKYKYLWNGRMVTEDQLPPIARMMFPTLDMYKRGK